VITTCYHKVRYRTLIGLSYLVGAILTHERNTVVAQ